MSHRSGFLFLTLCLVVLSVGLVAPAAAATFTVVSTATGADNDTGDGVCDDGINGCTLQAAVDEANSFEGTDTIAFNIPGGGPYTITTSTGFTITDPVVIDGTTQPDYVDSPIIEVSAPGGAGVVPGLHVRAGASTIRGLVINGFAESGILFDTAGGNTVEGCYIGLDVDGETPLGNDDGGIRISNVGSNTIGGTTAAARNVISADTTSGIRITGISATGNVVQGNFIGTNADCEAVIGVGNGIGIEILNGASGNTIGGTEDGAGNVISGNDGHGVYLEETTDNTIQGNYIGTDPSGTEPLSNGSTGVFLSADTEANTIGGTGTGASNIIAFNGDYGVSLDEEAGPVSQNAILGNSIHSNAGLGIELGQGSSTGVTANDAGDADSGANEQQNYPVITDASLGSTNVTGTLNSAASTAYRLEFFGSYSCDASGFGEGQTFLGTTDVTTDGSGDASFDVTLSETSTAGYYVTATATDPDNNTSEFSQCYQLPGSPVSGGATLWSVDQYGDLLRELDPSTGGTVASTTITLSGHTVDGVTGLAVDPTDGVIYGLLSLPGGYSKQLVTIDPETGVATAIGDSVGAFEGLAFTADGILYAVTGDEEGATIEDRETIFTLDKTDGTAAQVLERGGDDPGEAIAFSRDDGLLYHGSGPFDGTGEHDQVFESIDVDDLVSGTSIALSDALQNNVLALTWWDDEDVFLLTDRNEGFYRVTTDGVATLISDQIDQSLKGLAFDATGSTLYGLITDGTDLIVVDTDDGSEISQVNVSLAGESIENGNGLARDPIGGDLYALLDIGEDGRELVIIDPSTGTATSVGNTTDKFSGLAFASDGTLYGVTGDGAGSDGGGGGGPLEAETLYTLSLADGSPTKVGKLGQGGGGEAIGFNPDDGFIYHFSGDPTSSGGEGAVYESVDIALLAAVPSPTDIPLPERILGPPTAMTWWSDEGVFLRNEGEDLYRMTADGTSSQQISSQDLFFGGLAFDATEETLYAVSQADDLLRVVDPTDASTISSVDITLSGETVNSGYGLARDPIADELYALLTLSGQEFPELVTLDPATGIATSVGAADDEFTSLAFAADGTLYAATSGSGADEPNLLFTLSTADATSSYVMGLPRGGVYQRTLAFNTDDGLLYHSSGAGPSVVETIDLDGLPTFTEIVLSGDAMTSPAYTMTYSSTIGELLWLDNGELFRVTTGGVTTYIGTIPYVYSVTGLAFDASETTLYGVSSGTDELLDIDPADASYASLVSMTLSGETINSAQAIARDPVSGDFYVLLDLASGSGSERELATVNTATGVATSIGTTSQGFEELAFLSDGTLYGVTGGSEDVPEALYTISTTDASATFIVGLGRGPGDQAFAFNSDDGLLYHGSGQTADDDQIFESIDPAQLPATGVATDILLSDQTPGNPTALTWWQDEGVFLRTEFSQLFRLTSEGVLTSVDELNHDSKGMAFDATESAFYSLSVDGDFLYEVDPDDVTNSVSAVTITLSGETIVKGNGLARDPVSGDLYALLSVDDENDPRRLVTIDPTTGTATGIGSTGDRFAGLAFTDGTLYGITGDGANDPNTLFTLSTVDGSATRIITLSDGDGGEALGFNTDDGLLYHTGGSGSDAVFESIDPDDLASLTSPFTDLPVPSPAGVAEALTWWDDEDVFLRSGGDQLQRMTTAGATTLIADNCDETWGGLAFDAAGTILYGMPSSGDAIWELDPESSVCAGSDEGMYLAGDTIEGGTGLALDPVSGDLFALLELSSLSGNDRALATVDPTTGDVTLIGDTGDYFVALAFGDDGTLYAVTDRNADVPESLYRLDTSDGTPTLISPLGNGGEAIAFNPDDGLLYHESGDDDCCPSTRILETIDPADIPETSPLTPITLSGTTLGEFRALTWQTTSSSFLVADDGPYLYSLDPDGTTEFIGALDHDSKGLAFEHLDQILETTAATGLSGETFAVSGEEVPLFRIGLTGTDVTSFNGIPVTISDVGGSGTESADFASLRAWRSDDGILDTGTDTQIGLQSTVNVGSATTVPLFSSEVPASSSETFYFVTAVISSTAGHAFKVGFEAGGISTSSGDVGTAVVADDADKVTLSFLDETTAATGLSGESFVASGQEVQLFRIGVTGDGRVSLDDVTLTLADLATATGTVAADFTALHLYRSTDNSLDTAADTRIGTQATVNVGAATTVSPTAAEVPASGSETFYFVTAEVSSTPGHAFTVGFDAGGVTTSGGDIGTAFAADEADRVTIVLGVPVLVPFAGTTVAGARPTLDWSDVSGAESYVLEYADNAAFDDATLIGNLTQSEYTFAEDLGEDLWYWRVRAVGLELESEASATDSFRIFRLRADMSTLSFGTRGVGSSVSLSLVFPNPTNATVNVTSAEFSGANAEEFTISPTPPFAIPPAGEQQIDVTFMPDANGNRRATLTLFHDGAGGQITTALHGVGSSLTIDPESLDFASTNVGAAASQFVTIRNLGAARGGSAAILPASSFTVSPQSFSVPADGSRRLRVTFAPTSAGVHAATLTISSEALSTPVSVSLTASSNSAPVVANEIPNQAVMLRHTFVRNLLSPPSVFQDLDGDALTFSVTSANPSVATASLSGSRLTVTPFGRGRARITVQGEDASGLSVQTSFLVTVVRPQWVIDHIDTQDLPALDGDVGDWEQLFGPAHFTSDRFASVAGAVRGELDAADQALEMWIGWNDDTNRIYIGARVEDDAFGTNTQGSDPLRVGDSDAMEVFISADRSGGPYSAQNPHAQHYILNPAGTHGPILFPAGTAAPNQVQAVVQRSGTTTMYEWCIPGLDADFDEHDLATNQLLSLGFAFADFDSDAAADDGAYNAYSTLWAKSQQMSDNASRFRRPPFRLGLPAVNLSEPTSTGSDVTVDFEVEVAETASLTLDFDNVTGAGEVELKTKMRGEDPPTGFALAGSPIYYSLETTAAFTGPVELCFDIGGTSLAGRRRMALWHYADGGWENITTDVDLTNGRICGVTTSFSDFGIMQETLDAPVLVTFDGATVNDFTPTFDWGDVTDASTYTLEYSTDPGFEDDDTQVVADIAASTYAIPANLEDGTYYWRIKAFGDDEEESDYSAVDDFLLLPAVPSLVAVDDSEDPDVIPFLDWDDIEGAATYTLEYGHDNAFGSSTVVSELAVSEYTFAAAPGPGRYHWRVQALGAAGNGGGFADADSFDIVPGVPVLVALSGTTQEGFTPLLDWEDVAGAQSYTLELADDALFINSTEVTDITASQHTIDSPLMDATYHWRVKTVASGGAESAFSGADTFVIIPTFATWVYLALALTAASLVWIRPR